MFWSIKGKRMLIFPGKKFDNYESTYTTEGLSVLTLQLKTKRLDTSENVIIMCNAINSVGSISSHAKLTIKSQDDRPPPIIISGPTNQTLPIKSVAILNCISIGVPQPIISWYKDGTPIINTHKVIINNNGTLIINDLDKNSDQGLYTCVASSRSGKTTWSGYLRLELPTNPNIKFYRTPDVNKLPSLPGKPQYVNSTDDSLTITWLPSVKVIIKKEKKILHYLIC